MVHPGTGVPVPPAERVDGPLGAVRRWPVQLGRTRIATAVCSGWELRYASPLWWMALHCKPDDHSRLGR